ncbi:MAG: ABC transporter ATP-binding protein/permease [Lachnospiraceae bacterium]|nr:ABC transporter ATP-binding protein/permease [Lachnospiraceae bacterium]
MKKILDLVKKTLYILNPSQKKLCVLVFLATCIGSLLEMLGVSVILPLVNVIQSPDSIKESSLVKNNPALGQISYSELVTLIVGAVVVIYILKNIYFMFLSWLRVKFACKIQREVSVTMMTYTMSRGYKYFLDSNYGEYSRAVASDANAINGVVAAAFRIISETLTITMICVFLFITDWQLALSVLVLALLCLVLIYFVFRKMMYREGVIAREYGARMGQSLSQSYFGIKDVMLFRKQKFFIYQYEKNSIYAQKAQCRQAVGAESPGFIIEGICISGIMIAVCAKIVLFGSDAGFVATLATFAVGAFRVLPSLGRISSSMNSLSGCSPQINALCENIKVSKEYAKAHPEAADFMKGREVSKGLISKGGTYTFEEKKSVFSTGKFKDRIDIENITFAYNETMGNVLENVSLTIPKGRAVALIGESGAGKSTLVDILLGLLVPQNGCIRMDGRPITEIPKEWSDTIGYVPQSVFLCDDTIRNNVAFGEREEEIDEELVKDALDKAELSKFISTLPEGLDTMVGDRGTRLSGGQRQRIAIARALYHRPEILVLDEATSALDNNTESAIMSAINNLYGQVTMVIVAHRLTTVRNCDEIYEVRNNELVLRDKAEIFGQ